MFLNSTIWLFHVCFFQFGKQNLSWTISKCRVGMEVDWDKQSDFLKSCYLNYFKATSDYKTRIPKILISSPLHLLMNTFPFKANDPIRFSISPSRLNDLKS